MPGQQQLSTRCRAGYSAAAALIVCLTGTSLFVTSTQKVQWIQLPPYDFISGRSGPPIISNQDRNRDYQASVDPRQPIFTRIAIISPALVTLPAAEQDKGPETLVAKQTASADLAANDGPENTVEATSPDARPSYSFAGVWAPTAHACSPKANSQDLLPAVINQEGAWAGEVSCRLFGSDWITA